MQREKISFHKRNIITALVFIILVTAAIVWYSIYTGAHYKKEFYQVSSDKITGNMRVVFISDLHLKEYGKGNKKLIEDIKELKPDLIISGGDLIINDDPDYEKALSLCQKLSQIAPMYGVTGNHEDERIYPADDNKLIESFEDAGLKLLINEMETVEINGHDVELVGLSGRDTNFDKYGAKEFMDSLPQKKHAVRICIAHVPALFSEKLVDYSFDLGLSGHVHGGLMQFPKIGGLYSDEEGFFPELYSGLYELENAPLVVSRGMGDSNFIPRINNSHELSVIDFKWY